MQPFRISPYEYLIPMADEKHWRLVLGELEMVLPHMEGLRHPINTAARVTWWCSLPRLHQYTRSCTPSSWLVAYSWEGLWIVVQGLVLWVHMTAQKQSAYWRIPYLLLLSPRTSALQLLCWRSSFEPCWMQKQTRWPFAEFLHVKVLSVCCSKLHDHQKDRNIRDMMGN